jgi:hypothetical protein
LAVTAQAMAELQNLVWSVTHKMWTDYQKNQRGADVRRAGKFANQQAGIIVEALTDNYAKQADPITETEAIVQRESFPLNGYDQFFEQPTVVQAHQSDTEQGVGRGPFLQSARHSPGPDELSFGPIHLLWKWNKH